MSRLHVGIMLALVAFPGLLNAQRPIFSAMGGSSTYDLSGTGTAPFAALGLTVPLGRNLLVEPAVTYMRYQPDFGDPIRHLFPEAQLQAQLPLGPVAPYVGVGAGRSYQFRTGGGPEDWTLSTAGGLRLEFPSGWGLRAELRVREVHPWTATTADWGIGFSSRL